MALSDLEMSNLSSNTTTGGRHSTSTTTTQEEDLESDEEYGREKKAESTLKNESPEEPPCETETEHLTNHVTPMQSYNEERMRRNLQFFFMNPIEKWQAKRRFPYKFFIQVIKIVLVTMQLCLFAHSRYNHVNYTWGNKVTFSHLFLKGWDTTMEITAYPPSNGPLAIFLEKDFYDTIDYAITGYQNLSSAIGPYSYPNEQNEQGSMQLCLHQYKKGHIFGFNESYIFNPELEIICKNLTYAEVIEKNLGSNVFLTAQKVEVNFSALVQATLEFAIKTVNFKDASPFSAPDCYQFNIVINFDNHDHDGQMLLSLDAEPVRLYCHGDTNFFIASEIEVWLRTLLNVLVLVVCAVSFVLCLRAVYRAQLLRVTTTEFFRSQFNRELSFEGKMEFFNFWYIMIICNDVLLIFGSALKEQIEQKHFTANEWNTCSVLLGLGNLLVWFGVLRYLGFFKTYNVVILTLKRAAPKISRFLLCALLIYAGFTFCGWLVLGPYHFKFRSLATTAECLFSLINGDDMFATFATMSSKSDILWWFSRTYLYSFISLYIYVVLSLFISVIMDAYDTIKHYYKDGFPITDLRLFIGKMNPNDFSNGTFLADDEANTTTCSELFQQFCNCFRRNKQPATIPGYTSLSSGSV